VYTHHTLFREIQSLLPSAISVYDNFLQPKEDREFIYAVLSMLLLNKHCSHTAILPVKLY